MDIKEFLLSFKDLLNFWWLSYLCINILLSIPFLFFIKAYLPKQLSQAQQKIIAVVLWLILSLCSWYGTLLLLGNIKLVFWAMALLGISYAAGTIRLTKGFWPKGKKVFIASIVWLILTAFILYGPLAEYDVHSKQIMTWKIITQDQLNKPKAEDFKRNNPKGASAVELRFKNFPNYVDAHYSDELAAYLQKQGNKEIEVEFILTYSYGKLKGYNTARIGKLMSWKDEGAYMGYISPSSENSPPPERYIPSKDETAELFPEHYWPWNKTP